MTNTEAIERLKGLFGNGYTEQEKALEMGINALAKVEKYEQAIEDIKAVIKLLKKRYPQDAGYLYHKALDDVLEVIDEHIGGKNDRT